MTLLMQVLIEAVSNHAIYYYETLLDSNLAPSCSFFYKIILFSIIIKQYNF